MKKKSLIVVVVLAVLMLSTLFSVIYAMDEKETNSSVKMPNYTQIKGDLELNKGIDYNKQPSLGNKNSSVKVIEFADFKCPACKAWKIENFEKLQKEYIDSGKISFHFMNYAFIDRDSILAASAGEAIFKQGNDEFWEFYNLLFENQGDESEIWATESFLLEMVKDNIKSIDFKKFKKDLKEHTYMLEVKRDFKLGGAKGVNGTPKFLINGTIVTDSSYESLSSAIDKALKGK